MIDIIICKKTAKNQNIIETRVLGNRNIEITINSNGKKIVDILSDEELIKKCKDSDIKSLRIICEDSSSTEEAYDYILELKEKILDEITTLSFSKNIDINQFYINNPEFKNKKVVIDEKISLNDFKTLENIIKKYEGINAYIYITGNWELISLDECKLTMEYIKEVGEKIKLLNLSPFEKMIFVYDIVRDRFYKEEKEDEEYLKSRDLSKIISGDAIVCQGFSNLYSAILEYLGIESSVAYLTKKNNERVGHARNVMYIKDQKYKINGVYYLDATWDGKKEGKEKEFLYSYKFFAKTRKEFEELENHEFIYDGLELYSESLLEEYEKILIESPDDIEKIKMYTKEINRICRLTRSNIALHPIYYMGIKYYNIIKEKLIKVLKKYNKPIAAETYLKAINNVRKLEYYMDPEKYPYSDDTLYCILKNSKWEFKKKHLSDEEKLLKTIYGIRLKDQDRNIKDDFQGFMKKQDISREIKGVSLTRTLRSELERKKISVN